MLRSIVRFLSALWRIIFSPLLIGAPFVILFVACATGVAWMADWMSENRIIGLVMAITFFLFLCWVFGIIIKFANSRGDRARPVSRTQFRAFEVQDNGEVAHPKTGDQAESGSVG